MKRFFSNVATIQNRYAGNRSRRSRVTPQCSTLEQRTLFAVNPAVIDLLVPYTAAAMQGAGGQTAIVNKINRAVADLNLTLSNSQVNATVRLVGTMQTAFVEDPTGVTADLNALPTIPDIAAMKTQVGADLVDMWVGPASNSQRPPDAEGIAGEPTNLTQADPTQGYAVQWWGDSNANLTVHEIGHMLGGGHVQGQDLTPHTIPYAYDYIATVGAATYGTAIDDQAVTGGLIPYYSNPNVFFRGVPLGVADRAPNAADNAHVMNQLAPLIAGYSPTVVPDTTAPIAGLAQVQNTAGQNSFTFQVTYYDQGGVDVTTLGNSNIQVTGPNGFNAAATFSGIMVDGNLTPIAANTVNASVVTAVYTINTPAAPGDLAGYNFAVNAGQVKDVAGNVMSAGPLLPASGADPNTPNPQLLPRNAGDSTGFAGEEGNLSGSNWKITDFTGPYFYKEGSNYADYNTYRFSLSTAGQANITVNGPVGFLLYQDKNGDGQLTPDEQIAAAAPGIYNLAAGTNYYLQVSANWNGNGFGAGGVFTAEINVAGAVATAPGTSTLSGSVFQDANNNGTQDAGEPGIPNIAVTLTGTDANGNAVAQSVMTDATGLYTFSNLAAANATGYTVTITQPTGQPIGNISVGTAMGTANPSQTTPSISGIASGTTPASGYNFAELPIPAGGSVSGEVYNDANANMMLDAGEAGIGGVQITLTGTSDLGTAVNMTATTAADGTYTFSNVPSVTGGGYSLKMGPALGFDAEAAMPGQGNTLGFSGVATGIDSLAQVSLNPGDVLTSYNFARTASAGQTPPTAGGLTVVTNQNQTANGNVLNASTPGSTTAQAAAQGIQPAKTNKKQALMSATLEGAPQHALHFSLNADGTFSYTPMPGFHGKDTFKYVCIMKATGLCSDKAGPVTIIVRHVDQAPKPSTETFPALYTAQGVPVAVDLRSLVSDSDSKISSLRFHLGKTADGTFTLEKDGHTALFTPNPTFAGIANIQFKASDGIKVSSWITLSVTVEPINEALSVANETVTARHGHSILIDVLSKTIDTVAGAKLKVAIVSGPSNGTSKIIRNRIFYHPAAGASTTDSITYSVTDNFGNTKTGMITINVS